MRYCKVNGGTKLESGAKARSQTKAIDDPKQWKGIKSISILVSFSLLFNDIIIILLHLHIIAPECAAAFSGYLFFLCSFQRANKIYVKCWVARTLHEFEYQCSWKFIALLIWPFIFALAEVFSSCLNIRILSRPFVFILLILFIF